MCSTYTCAVHTRLALYRALGGPRAGTRAIHIMYLHIATAEVVITETEERERERERGGGGGGGGGRGKGNETTSKLPPNAQVSYH